MAILYLFWLAFQGYMEEAGTCNKTNSTRVIIVDGDIGAGKSTLLKALHAKWPTAVVMDEPKPSRELLDGQYRHRDGRLQQFFHTERVQQWLQLCSKVNQKQASTILMERSILSCIGVFGSRDPRVVGKICHYLSLLPVKPEVYFLLCEPEEAFARVKTRGREGEEALDVKQLALLHRQYEKFATSGLLPVVRVIHTTRKSPEEVQVEFQTYCDSLSTKFLL